MDIQTRKLNLISYLTQIQDEEILKKIEDLVKRKKATKEGVDVKPFTQKELIRRIEKSEKEFKNGNFKTQEELEKLVEKW